jgi:Zn-dependent protease/CBS domain-containing protein
MSWSFKVMTVRGIPIRIHISFLLILLWAGYSGLVSSRGSWPRSVLFMVAFVLLLFVCVVLHELGHSLMAQLFGVRVQDITLWPIGGVARIARLPETPLAEFLITAAGPAVNVALAAGLGALALLWIGPRQMLTILSSPWLLERFLATMDLQALLVLLVANNIILVVFNLLPAFPMDGGRLLRSFLAAFLPFQQATRVASAVGQGLAIVIGAGALVSGNLLLALVGVFVFMAAWQERQQVALSDNLRGLRVRQAMQPIGLRLYPLQTLGEAAAQIATSPQAAFLVVDAGRLVGLLTRKDLLTAIRRAGPWATVGQHLRRDIVRLHPDTLLVNAQEQLQRGQAMVGIVVDQDRVIGTLSLWDLARLAELLAAHPEVLPRG